MLKYKLIELFSGRLLGYSCRIVCDTIKERERLFLLLDILEFKPVKDIGYNNYKDLVLCNNKSINGLGSKFISNQYMELYNYINITIGKYGTIDKSDNKKILLNFKDILKTIEYNYE